MKQQTTHIVLAISLGLNLLIVGAAIGFGLRERPGPRFPAHLSDSLETVAPEVRDQISAEIRRERKEGRELHKQMRNEQRQLAKVILSEPFDPEAARSAFAKTRQARDAVQQHMHEQMLLVLAELDKQQRAQLMRRILRPNTDGGPRQPHREG
jgi:uncharacterized membrane protein